MTMSTSRAIPARGDFIRTEMRPICRFDQGPSRVTASRRDTNAKRGTTMVARETLINEPVVRITDEAG
ncbi:hypothetical protein, partial [Burkholderia sp.]|uniref:hypothetical protein n=1 Tax=Burkholderia sp. TaxID=36773 RepID=UPI0034643E26